MSFVVADSKESAYKEALSRSSAELLANDWKISMHIEMEVPDLYLGNEVERIKYKNTKILSELK
jgi:hypothetical protein